MIPCDSFSSRTSKCPSWASADNRFVECRGNGKEFIVKWCAMALSIPSARCSVDRRLVSVTESGSSLQARFSALFFLLQNEYRDIYLHCSLSLCNRRRSFCVPVSHTFFTSSVALPIHNQCHLNTEFWWYHLFFYTHLPALCKQDISLCF